MDLQISSARSISITNCMTHSLGSMTSHPLRLFGPLSLIPPSRTPPAPLLPSPLLLLTKFITHTLTHNAAHGYGHAHALTHTLARGFILIILYITRQILSRLPIPPLPHLGLQRIVLIRQRRTLPLPAIRTTIRATRTVPTILAPSHCNSRWSKASWRRRVSGR